MNDNRPASFRPELIKVESSGCGQTLQLAADECGIVLASDGSFRMFSCVTETAAFDQSLDLWSPREHRVVENAKTLRALALALSNEQVMAVLHNLVTELDQVS